MEVHRGTDGNRWESKGNLWKSKGARRKTDENNRKPRETHGNPEQRPMGNHMETQSRDLWKLAESQWKPKKAMENQWKPMETIGTPQGNQRKTIGRTIGKTIGKPS